MKDETSIFGAKPERLDRLVFEALQDFDSINSFDDLVLVLHVCDLKCIEEAMEVDK